MPYNYYSTSNTLTVNESNCTYGNNWRDLLTAFDGETITYDASGNPLSYYNGTHWTFTWENGRSLATATDGTTSITYAYDAGGLRTSKIVNGLTHNYLYASGQLMRETYGNNTLDFFYDANGYPYALKYNSTTYYYITNLQGDVMYLIDANENTVASYEYDPYGNIVSATGTMAEINPMRYRGYYYDAELEMYYLQSRYYDPQICRFINADDISALGGSGTFSGYNLFAYCLNNPINMVDMDGREPISLSLFLCYTLVVAVVCVGTLALVTSPAFQRDWNRMCSSVVNSITSGLRSIGGAVAQGASVTAAKAKSIAQDIYKSFASIKTVPTYRSSRETHHIVAKMAHNAQQAKNILAKVGIGINSSLNLVSLKTGLHRRLHTNAYYGWANSVIISAYNSANGNRSKQYANVVSALGVIRSFLLSMDAVAPF